ncbi:MAG: LysM peptidoglycan-binding domain-containing M23 family metallopeptidase [Chloroflexota bacterium]|nr:LysM peptidoglycan-binding domain-containing M23 family metallopeptidase [Chloroflexota bacterium]
MGGKIPISGFACLHLGALPAVFLLLVILFLSAPNLVYAAPPTPPAEKSLGTTTETVTPMAQPEEQQLLRYFLPLAVTNASTFRGHEILPPPGEHSTYILQEHDDLSALAIELGRDVDVMACVSPSSSFALSLLRPGQEIIIPGPEYLCHTVTESESLVQIAERYQVAVSAILETAWNELDTDGIAPETTLTVGRRLLIPYGVRSESDKQAAGNRRTEAGSAPATTPDPTATPASEPVPEPTVEPPIWPYGDGDFVWPVDGIISQGFAARHKAIDIAAPVGSPVRAVDNGVVLKAGYSKIGYGGRIIIDHNIDYVTLYAHLHQSYVEQGDVVKKGQIIGTVGSTGNSTGPHLHFELRDFGYLIDPEPLLEP